MHEINHTACMQDKLSYTVLAIGLQDAFNTLVYKILHYWPHCLCLHFGDSCSTSVAFNM